MKKKRPKFKIITYDKIYKIEDSPFYKLTTKKKLAVLLKTDLLHLTTLIEDKLNYSSFEETNKKNKKRWIERPNIDLDLIHSRIASFLCRIEIPNFVHSGRKNHSHISNAKIHIGNHKVLTTDIRSFYPSTTRKHVFNFFNKKLQCSADVADLISLLCTYNDHIPTGSRISMPLALWANMGLFLELEKLAIKYDIKMTLFVDDVTFSGDKLNALFVSSVKKIVERYGHNIHPNKTILYSKNDLKLITGVIVNNDELLVKNEQHKYLYDAMEEWNELKDSPHMPEIVKNRLLGRLNSLGVINPKYKEKAQSIRNYKIK